MPVYVYSRGSYKNLFTGIWPIFSALGRVSQGKPTTFGPLSCLGVSELFVGWIPNVIEVA